MKLTKLIDIDNTLDEVEELEITIKAGYIEESTWIDTVEIQRVIDHLQDLLDNRATKEDYELV
jgi:hypothetical protein